MIIIMTANISFAKIWRVNNTGVPADFTTAQLANDNASVANGDTIHIEPSGTSYGSLCLYLFYTTTHQTDQASLLKQALLHLYLAYLILLEKN